MSSARRNSKILEDDPVLTLKKRIVETVAGTYTEIELDLPNNVLAGEVYDLDEVIVVDNDSTVITAASTFGTRELIVSTVSLAAMPVDATLNNETVKAFYRKQYLKDQVATAGVNHVDQTGFGFETKEEANLIAVNKIFIGIKSTNMSGVMKALVHFKGAIRKLNSTDFQTILAQQLLNAS